MNFWELNLLKIKMFKPVNFRPPAQNHYEIFTILSQLHVKFKKLLVETFSKLYNSLTGKFKIHEFILNTYLKITKCTARNKS